MSEGPLERLEQIVARLEEMGFAPPSPLALGPLAAPVNPDGTPGNVAAGELIESAWGNAVVDTLDMRPRGIYSRVFKPSFEGGFAAGTEFVIAGLNALTTVAGRLTSVHYALIMTPQTLPVAESYIDIKLRLGGDTTGAVQGRAMHGYRANFQAFGPGAVNLAGSFHGLGFAPSASLVLTCLCGAGSIGFEANSLLVLEDMGGS